MNDITGLKRNSTLDQYYTKKSVANTCLDVLNDTIHISKTDYIIEPSAGNGAFIDGIKALTSNHLFLDIEPMHPDIIKQDFLTYTCTIETEYIHVVGNPPFGRQSKTAISFIKKCSEFACSISFILPKSFRKKSMQRHFNEYYHLIRESELCENAFMINGNEWDVPCIFQIWMYSVHPRDTPLKEMPNGYIFVKKTEYPDISFRRVGVYAGRITNVINDKSEQSHYFIKFTNGKNIFQNISILHGVLFDEDNTVGPRSINKAEIIEKYNRALMDNAQKKASRYVKK